ncbi:MAG TPA: chromate resistance protein ChrB domain-containing protein [Thermoanaerobaculia bacterium]|nr:chromate resistance protein ChrB domain-containing protein [Thermoanaerobaculia bacterium]
MQWVGFTSSLVANSSSSRRVAVWRRLRQLGALAPAGSLYLLPLTEANVEALGWLAQEIEDEGGEALVVRIEALQDAAQGRLVELFRSARGEEYRKLTAEAEEILAGLESAAAGAERSEPSEPSDESRGALERLHRRFAEISRIDFFQAAEGTAAGAALARLEGALERRGSAPAEVPAAARERYRGRRWVTRPRPHVDRLACAWLIRRFVDPDAAIRYAETPEPGEVAFDMRRAELGHVGNRCSFETMLAAFGLHDSGLAALAEIVHEIDLRDGRSARPEIAGVERILTGWSTANLPDAELERLGTALFEGLYAALGSLPPGPADPVPAAKPARRPPRRAKQP